MRCLNTRILPDIVRGYCKNCNDMEDFVMPEQVIIEPEGVLMVTYRCEVCLVTQSYADVYMESLRYMIKEVKNER